MDQMKKRLRQLNKKNVQNLFKSEHQVQTGLLKNHLQPIVSQNDGLMKRLQPVNQSITKKGHQSQIIWAIYQD